MNLVGLDLIGAVTIPTAGASYTDAKTVTAVQFELRARGYDLGKTGTNGDGVDGLYGSKTKAAVQKLQTNAGIAATGKIDEWVVKILGVVPGQLPPGVSVQANAALQAEVALEAATTAEHAVTPGDVQAVAQTTYDLAPPAPPALKQAPGRALAKAKAAETPAEVKEAAGAVQSAATAIHEAVKPAWYLLPAWEGGPAWWVMGLVVVGSAAGLGVTVWGLSGPTPRPRPVEGKTALQRWREERGVVVR